MVKCCLKLYLSAHTNEYIDFERTDRLADTQSRRGVLAYSIHPSCYAWYIIWTMSRR